MCNLGAWSSPSVFNLVPYTVHWFLLSCWVYRCVSWGLQLDFALLSGTRHQGSKTSLPVLTFWHRPAYLGPKSKDERFVLSLFLWNTEIWPLWFAHVFLHLLRSRKGEDVRTVPTNCSSDSGSGEIYFSGLLSHLLGKTPSAWNPEGRQPIMKRVWECLLVKSKGKVIGLTHQKGKRLIWEAADDAGGGWRPETVHP